VSQRRAAPRRQDRRQRIEHRDPWGSPHSIVCTEDDITVISTGPGKKIGTPDDIVAPPEAAIAQRQ